MAFEKIHLIHPITSAAEEEYTKKFFRFIGCQVYGRPVNECITQEWNRKLLSANDAGGIDVVMNYYGEDPYLADSFRRGVRRVYFYFDLKMGFCEVCEIAVRDFSQLTRENGNAKVRQTALRCLIQAIWKNNVVARNSIWEIHNLYFGIKDTEEIEVKDNDDLFFLLQIKRCMRVMTMGEILNDRDAYIRYIPLYEYIRHILKQLSEICFSEQLSKDDTIYSLYTRVNAAMAMFEVLEKLYPRVREGLDIRVMSEGDVFRLFEDLLDRLPESLSVLLLYARFCKYRPELYQMEEGIYRYIQQLVPENQAEYSYIWYRIGYYYEKVKQERECALIYYQKAVCADPDFYQAVFKLGYFAALEHRYKEAEMRLNEVVKIMFHGNDMGPGESDEYTNWAYLSLKDCQYAYKAYILLAKIAVNSEREYSTRAFVGSACLAATMFEKSTLEGKLCDSDEASGKAYFDYHQYSTPVWSMWKVLSPWSEQIIRDDFVKQIVRGHLAKWQ